MRRREFIVLPAASLGGVLLHTLGGESAQLNAQAPSGEIKVPLRFFSAAEARIVQAAAERIFPADASGPGATEAGVVIYIDRQLAGPYGRDKYRYTKGPFVDSGPEHGYQGKETPREVYRAGVAGLTGFAEAKPEEQDQRLRAIQTSNFFRLLRQHTLEGMFSDPVHGGNVNMAGWQLIGYPGPVMSYRDEIDKHFGEDYRRKPVSLAQVTGRKVTGWEDEKD